jgi:hypothetical protein
MAPSMTDAIIQRRKMTPKHGPKNGPTVETGASQKMNQKTNVDIKPITAAGVAFFLIANGTIPIRLHTIAITK